MNPFEQAARDVQATYRYHDKRYPHTITVRLNDEQYNKIKGDVSSIIRHLIDLYE